MRNAKFCSSYIYVENKGIGQVNKMQVDLILVTLIKLDDEFTGACFIIIPVSIDR